ncbi:MAG: multiheme c-type cytochrome [Candidatus Eisenbacteria bacterium]
MGYDALAIGDKEISWGLDELEVELNTYGLQPVSNNILDAETGKPRFEPYRIVKVGRLDVGVTATIGGTAVVPRTLVEREGIEIANPVARSREALDAMRKKKADVFVLIAHTGMDKAEELVDSLPGYDVILVGHEGRKLEEPKKEKGVLLAASGSRSSWLGEVTLTVQKGKILNSEGRSFELKQSDGPYDEFLREILWTKLELDENGNRVARKPQEKKQEEDESAVPAQERKIASAYTGGEKCGFCHADVQGFWSRTAHASAFKTIAESEDWEKPECWNCHVVGFGEKTGHSKTALDPVMWNVQCEACHGMGTEHLRGAERKRVDEATCRSCHTPEWSPDFDYQKYLKKISCAAARRPRSG